MTLSNAAGRVCTKHEVDGGDGVATHYLGYLPLFTGFTWGTDPITLQHRFEPASGEVLSAGAPICNPACAHGACVSGVPDNTCDCTGSGYSGAVCDVPVCTTPCANGGLCVAADTCDCAGTGYGGATCEADVDECQAGLDDCDVAATCTNTPGAFTCACEPGFVGDGVTCTACAPGSVQPDAGQAACVACAPGSYDDGTGEVCVACGPGYVQPIGGQSSCDACGPGTFDDGTSEVCGDCAAGSYQDSAGQTSCIDCPAGRHQALAGQSSCDACAPGSYQALTGQSSCDGCADGYVQPSAGQIACDACPAGRYDDGTETCAACAAGSFQDQQGQISCGACPAGTSQALTGQTSCDACGPGYVQPIGGQSSCDACGPGTFDDGTSEVCGDCAAGSYQDSAGQTSCIDCPLGRYQALAGQSSCDACAPGSYQALTGQSSCDGCADGYVQPSAGQIACDACPAGRHDDGTETCAACAAGSFQDQQGQISCGACPAGTSQALTGQTSCGVCGSGDVQPLTGQASCEPCVPGSYDAGGSEVCTACAPGSFQNSFGQTSCPDCGAGSFQASSGQTSCDACAAGTYQASTGQTSCDACATGEVQPSTGQISCDACAAGTYDDGSEVCASCDPGHCAGTMTCADGTGVAISCDSCTIGWSGATCTSYTTTTTCLALLQSGVTTSGPQVIDPDGLGGAASASSVWCDMSTDGGGYTVYKASVGSAYDAVQAEAYCAGLGMSLFIPRTQAHLASAWSLATGTTYGPDAGADYLSIMGIYPGVKGATCLSTALSSNNASCGWVAGDGGSFWVSTRTDITEPNGDNDLDASMGYTFDGSGTVTHYNDVVSPGYTSTHFMCDVGDKDGLPTSCLGWRALGYTTSTTYTVDPDGAGGIDPFTVWCDMSTDGGGYTFYKVLVGSAYDAIQAEAHCASLGMQLFIPRTQAHLTSAFSVATSSTFGPDANGLYLYILGIYPQSKGATCKSQPFNSDNPTCYWRASDDGRFWVSDRSDVTEPNGDNDVDASMGYQFDASGIVTWYNDIVSPGLTSTRFMCDIGDKNGP